MELILSRYLKALEERVLAMIGEAKRTGRHTIVLVPSQASFLMEKQIIARFGGFCDIEVMVAIPTNRAYISLRRRCPLEWHNRNM